MTKDQTADQIKAQIVQQQTTIKLLAKRIEQALKQSKAHPKSK